ncbi:MAG: CRISPR-associated protein Cas5 [Spirochaetaceae bacterium]|nr:CRISPR-associated protein Cas5 [Spirochaetaceae bacterium]
MAHTSYFVEMEISGDTAMWTRPDTGDTPVSEIVPSYSAVKAIFESILLGFNSIVKPIKVEICAPIQYHSYYTNYGGPLRESGLVKSKDSFQLLATVLINVSYRIYAEVVPNTQKIDFSEKSQQWDKRTTSPAHAYVDIFNRRLKRGQCYSIPFLGWKEFTTSYFGPFRDDTKVCSSISTTIPAVLRQVFSEGYHSPVSVTYYQNANVTNGIMLFNRRD